ncbi:MAG: molybdopterin cofactor-binding domain-containing protein [Pseudomonadota bacterium]
MSTLNYSRRGFLRAAGVTGGGLVVGFSLSGCSAPGAAFDPKAGALVPNSFVQITPDNQILFYCPRDEMGQGVTTGLTTLVAEDLDVDPAAFTVELAGAHPDYVNPDFGAQGTGGSTSIKAHYWQLRQVGADTRALILDAAAQDLGVARNSLSTDNGHVISGGERHPYGKFVATAASLEVPVETPLKAASEFNYIGTDFTRLDGVSKSTGTAIYGIDVDVPGMLHGVIQRSPVAGAMVESFDASAARNMPGVIDVVQVATGVAAVAEKYWQAKQAAAQIKIQWSTPPLASVSHAQMLEDYKAGLAEEGESAASQGDVATALASATKTIDTQYFAPYLAHAPMEPMNAVVHVRDGEADVWTGSQGPGAVQGLVARFADLEMENVRSHQTYLGGAFGRRATLHHVIEATQLSMATNKPVQVLWSREDDTKSGVFRPASLMNIKAGIDDNGKVSAWQVKRVGGNITPETLKNALPGFFPGLPNGVIDWVVGMSNSAFDGWVVDYSSIEGFSEDYDLPNHDILHVTKDHGLPLTFWRSVGHSYTAFAKETAMDELAALAEQDPVQFRIDNLENNPRLRNVVKVAGEHMQKMQPAPGRALGLAAHGSFNSYVAEVAEVSIEKGQIKVHSVLCVVDCGVAINPDIVKAQMEGSVMYGLTAALHGHMELDNGEIKQSNFHDYPILRMNEAPRVDVVIIESQEDPTGVGEPGLPPIAPAVANAVYHATGQRLRDLPLKLA